MECLRRFFVCCLCCIKPSPPNSPTEHKSQTQKAAARGIPNQNGGTFFHGVGQVVVENATFSQHIGSDPSTSQPGGSSTGTAVNQNAGYESNTSVQPGGQYQIIGPPIRAPYEIYHEELLKQKRGSPLWFPGPNSLLPLPYRQSGINVGDVGIIQIDEPFDFLFNIFLPADDPINSKGVPDSFKPLGECDTSEVTSDMQGGSVGSSSVRRSVHGEPSGLTFETSAAEGAILVLPQGSSRRSIIGLQRIKDYMTPSTVESWYQYAKNRGRELHNGNIVVVYRCDKASSWGIATFSSTEGQTTSLTFKEANGDQPVTYGWVCNGTANTQMRVGPSSDENIDIPGVVNNQCVFLHTLNARLSETSWRELVQRLGAKVDEDFQYPAFVEGSTKHPLPACTPTTRKFQKRFFDHPSSVLNTCLLENCPNARMVITTDEDWISLMTQEGALLPSHQLFEQIQRSHIIRSKYGVVSLDQSEPSRSNLSIAGFVSRYFSRFSTEKAVKAATNALHNYRNSQQEEYLTTVITRYRHAYETSNEKHVQFPDIIMNYTALLNKQDQLSGGKSNLEEVIRLLEEARAVMERRSSRMEKYGVLLNNLGQAYLDRYRISKTGRDLQSARDTFEWACSQNRSSPVSPAYATSLIGSASVIWTACKLQPPAATDIGRFNVAITLLETAQEQSDDVEVQAECYRHLASVYDLLYTRTRDPRDLDLSIDYYSRVIYMLHPQSPSEATTLANLAKQHFERQKLPNAQPDLTAARRYRDEAQTLVGEGPEADELRKEIDVLTKSMEEYCRREPQTPSVSSSRGSMHSRKSSVRSRKSSVHSRQSSVHSFASIKE